MRRIGLAPALIAALLAGPWAAGALAQQTGTAPAPAQPAPAQPAGASGAAGATTSPDLGVSGFSSGSGPVEIDASEGIEWRQDQKVYIARGNARAARGDTSLSADTLIAHYRGDATGKTSIYEVEAIGHVVIVSKDARIVGDRAVYNLDTGSAVMTGNGLKATNKDQFVTARDSLEYWEKQNAVVARGNANAGNPTQQVKADMLTGYFKAGPSGNKQLYQVEGKGNVVVTGRGSIAHAAKAIYNMDSDIATLEGGVKISRGQNQINGERAIYNLKTGQAKITGGSSQVKTLLVPGSDSGKLNP